MGPLLEFYISCLLIICSTAGSARRYVVVRHSCIESISAFMIHPSARPVLRFLVVVSKASSVRERRLSVRLALTRLEEEGDRERIMQFPVDAI